MGLWSGKCAVEDPSLIWCVVKGTQRGVIIKTEFRHFELWIY